MDKITGALGGAYGAAVTFWAAGIAMTARNLVQCATQPEGWGLFLQTEYEVAALTAVIAAPTALALRRLGWMPAAATPSTNPATQE